MLARQRPDREQPLLDAPPVRPDRSPAPPAPVRPRPAPRPVRSAPGPAPPAAPPAAPRPARPPLPASAAHRASGPRRPRPTGRHQRLGDILADPSRALHQAAARIQRRLLARLRVQLVQFARPHGAGSLPRPPPRASAASASASAGARLAAAPPRPPAAAPGPARQRHPAAPGARAGSAARGRHAGRAVPPACPTGRAAPRPTTRRSLTQAVLRPSAVLTRRRISSSSASIPASSSTARAAWPAGRSKTAVTSPCAAPCAHQFGPPAPAQHEAQRIQQDRLARPGLAGQHVQARLEAPGSAGR